MTTDPLATASRPLRNSKWPREFYECTPLKMRGITLFTVAAWDANCPQHIPQRFEGADVVAALTAKDHEIATMKAELAGLKATCAPQIR